MYHVSSRSNTYVVRPAPLKQRDRSADDRTLAHLSIFPLCATPSKVSKPSLHLNEGPTPRQDMAPWLQTKQQTRQHPASPAPFLVDWIGIYLCCLSLTSVSTCRGLNYASHRTKTRLYIASITTTQTSTPHETI